MSDASYLTQSRITSDHESKRRNNLKALLSEAVMSGSCITLQRNNFLYEYFIRTKVLEAQNDVSKEELLERIMFLARFAWRNHAGYYYDGRLENILFDYGQNLEKRVDERKIRQTVEEAFTGVNKGCILHVATELGAVGGHTRVIWQFLKRYKDNDQILVLTGQSAKDVPGFMHDIGSDIPIISLCSISSLFERSYALRCIAGFCKAVVSYHHPYDVVPIMAFSDVEGPPVLIENHAHSWFWLGPSIADLVFAHSAFHRDFTLRNRPLTNVCYVPGIQLDDLEEVFEQKRKVEAKVKLGMSADSICIMTIGTPEKFIPNAGYDFFRTAYKILETFPQAHLFVVGIPESADLRKEYDLTTRRLHLVGAVTDPTVYYNAADICLDALPQPSLGGTLYATLIGMACPLYKYGPGNVFHSKHIQLPLYRKHIGDPKTSGTI